METPRPPEGRGAASVMPGDDVGGREPSVRAVHSQSANLFLFGGWEMGAHGTQAFIILEWHWPHLSDAKVLVSRIVLKQFVNLIYKENADLVDS